MKRIFLLCIGLLSLQLAKAQTDEIKWSIGFHGGLTQYNGDRGPNFYTLNQAAYGFGGFSVSRYLNRYFDAMLFSTRGEIGNVQPLSSWSEPTDIISSHFRARINTATLALRFNFVSPQAPVRPYLFAGVGVINTEKRFTVTQERWDAALPAFGAGLKFRFGDIVALQIQETFMYTTWDGVDHTIRGTTNDAYLFHSAGLTFNIGDKPDADKDGVTDKKDLCAGTPEGIKVDVNGCPIDSDKDGVADYLDNCPDVPGLSTMGGCPDKDGDGITDKEDRCPDMAGPLSLRGCPDTDGDGVVDIIDRCPGTKAGYKVDTTGCPIDTDKDGVVDEEDRCPTLAGPQAQKGCPDTDNDGITDDVDLCPKVAGTAANRGCPEIPKTEINRITVIASKIFFETGKATLKVESLAQLDELVNILNKYPEASLVIEGHTDNVGEDAANLDLSQRRADAVKAYLVSKGVSPQRLTAIGYGETKPVADNGTSTGRAKNRRVELKTLFK